MELAEKKVLLTNHFCKLNRRRSDGLPGDFVLKGYIRDVTEQGIIFETRTQISFLAWTEICDLVVLQ